MDYKNEEQSEVLSRTEVLNNMPGKEEPLNTFMSVEKASKIIAELGLSSLRLGDYMVIVKPDFDLMLAGEPYVALMLLFNLRNGTFISRVWNQTVKSGYVADTKQLVGECINHFEQRPCIGCPEEESEYPSEGFLVSQTPVPRKISIGCHKVIEKDVDAGYKSCRECLELSNAIYPQCKVEITEGKGEIVKEAMADPCATDDPSDMDTSQNIYDMEDNPGYIQHGEFNENGSKETIPTNAKSNRWRNQFSGDSTDGTSDYFKCPWCDRKFIDTSKNRGKKLPKAFYIHRKMEHFWGFFMCPKCQFKANFARDLMEHIRNADHREESLADCPQCKKKVAFLSLDTHYESCVISAMKKTISPVAPKEKCPWCEEYFIQGSRTLESHKKRVHFWGDFKCAECNFQANFIKDLIVHAGREEHNDKQKVTCPRCRKLFKLFDMESHFANCKTRETSFKCPWCPSTYTWNPIIKWENRFKSPHGPFGVHKKTVHFWGTFRCPECEFEANFAQELVDHMQNEGHISEPSVKCPQCVQEISIPKLSSHYEACVQSLKRTTSTPVSKAGGFYGNVFPKKCDFCDFLANTKGGYQAHCRRTHFRGKFKCLTCKFVAYFAKDLIEHMETEGKGTVKGHMANPFADCPSCKQRIQIAEIGLHYEVCVRQHDLNKKNKYDKKRVCETCGKTIPGANYKDHLKMHMRKQGATEDEFKKTLKKVRGNTEEHKVRGDTNFFHYCDKCNKRFTNIGRLNLHIREEHEKIEFKCEECEESFKKYNQLGNHIRLVHSLDEKYNCKDCGKRFTNTATLRSHIKYHHEAPRFKCSFCGRMLKDESRLVAHERQHTGEKPFKCSVCNSAYTSKSSLDQHEAGAHSIDSSRGRKLGWHGKKQDFKPEPL